MTLADALGTRSATDQALVGAKLSALASVSGTHGQVGINIRAESRLDASAWTDFIDTLLDTDDTAAALQAAITDFCRRWTLTGPIVTGRNGAVFGRALTLQALARSFVSSGYFGSLAAAETHLRSLIGRPLSSIRTQWQAFQLGTAGRPIWATFDLAGRRPFEGLPQRADYIRGVHGLSRADVGAPLLLLEYVLSSPIEARFPTIADAYAGQMWICSFRPAEENVCNHGWTMPWDEYVAEPRRPEVVHAPMMGNSLAHALSEVAP